jgi:16S rRNA (guanine527-N7)-methyltransferase
MNSSQLLASGVQQLNIHADEKQLSLLMQYVQLLQKWNQAYNLTAIEDTDEIISKHILDSLSVAEHLMGKNIIDIGSGAGLPGIPLAILCEDKKFTLLDSNAKKTRFIQQAVIDLRLNNIQVLQSRVEDYLPSNHSAEAFNTLISRAFASSDKLFASCEQLLKNLDDQGRIIFMLAKQKHLEALPNRYNVVDIYSIKIPQLDAQRHIAIVEKTAYKN